MKTIRSKVVKMILVAGILVPCMMSLNTLADSLPAGVDQVWTAVEGNIIYYVSPGEKVKKGDPLFYVVTSENNPALFFQIQHKVDYCKLLYLRRKKLLKTHAVSQEDLDNALHDYINAKDDMASFLCQVKLGFYSAPYDCEIVKLLYLQDSGIGDGNPAINIKPIDKNYKFVAQKPNKKFIEMIRKSDQLTKMQINSFDVKDTQL